MALHFICLAHLLNTIFSCITSIFISFLYFGQYSGNFTRTVSSYTFVLVFPPQIGQWIQREFFRLSFTLYTSNNGIAPRWSSGFCLFIVYSKRANIRFCEWLVFPTYDNAFKQKIAYTGGRTWIIRILAIIVVFFILAIVTLIITEGIKQYEKMCDEISQMFLVGSLSGISVLGDAIREYLPVNLILLFGFVNTGIMLLKMYFRKKFDYM